MSDRHAETGKELLEDSRWAMKAMLRLVATAFGLVAMALFAAAVAYTNDNFVNTSGNGDWPDGLCLAPVCSFSARQPSASANDPQIILSLLYNPIALVMHLLFRKKRPIHPAIRIALDLIVWGLSVPAMVFAIGSGAFWYWSPPIASVDGSIDCTFFFNVWAQECTPVAYTIGKLEIAGLVFLFFLLYVYSVLP